jgi:hypothetical protein
MWEQRQDAWWADGPVVLDFDGRQVEINHMQMDLLSITFGAIDLDTRIDWLGHRRLRWLPTFGGPKISWRYDTHSEMAALYGRPLTGVQVLIYRPGKPGDFADGTVSIGFSFGGWQLEIYNALDENGLSFEAMGTDREVVWGITA